MLKLNRLLVDTSFAKLSSWLPNFHWGFHFNFARYKILARHCQIKEYRHSTGSAKTSNYRRPLQRFLTPYRRFYPNYTVSKPQTICPVLNKGFRFHSWSVPSIVYASHTHYLWSRSERQTRLHRRECPLADSKQILWRLSPKWHAN